MADIAYPPDVIVHGIPDLKLYEIQPLLDWDLEDPNNVLNVLACLRKRHQGLEFFVINPPDGETKVLLKFLLNLSLDPANAKSTPNVVVKITYSIKNASVTNVQRESYFDPPTTFSRPFKLPEFKKDATVIDFVMDAEEHAGAYFRDMLQSGSKKKAILLAVINEFRSKCLEYDDDHFSYASFVFDMPFLTGGSDNSITMLVNVHMADGLPIKVYMSSTLFTHPDGFTPETTQLSARIDSDMAPEQVIGRLRTALTEQIPAFHSALQQHKKGPS
ncbi:hypothetical protein HDU67_006637 [Dinochytrium kinnereticum]|nr:hypothetical protein HDU67_006637 [Dinochytrium kinnereticum]